MPKKLRNVLVIVSVAISVVDGSEALMGTKYQEEMAWAIHLGVIVYEYSNFVALD